MSVAFVLGIVAVLATTLVGLPGVAPVARTAQPLVDLAALDQDWRLFAPEPPRTALRLEAITTWSDGSTTTWRIPEGGPWLGAYSDYRWRKWTENASSDERLWRPTAGYVLAHQRRPAGTWPVELRLVRRLADIRAAGHRGAQHWVPRELYRARYAPRRS
ncbi:hypothetical protein [Solirubrobacter soli]|uniref:hypothetical protein n=1 Tax=Solirubrobacter soli TaxID=363832 RepID=UPI0012F9FBB6|nr:hypothetical protein [Solirubrobacter soli]